MSRRDPLAISDNKRNARRVMIGFGGLALIQLIVASIVTTGPFSIDDVVYRLMAESAANGAGVFVQAGYEEIPSSELLPLFVDAADGRATAQYPSGYAFLVAPFLSVLGPTAFPLLNSVAFLTCLALCYSIATRVLPTQGLAVLSAALFGFATFAWEYSVGVWPHMVTLAFGLAAFRLVLHSLDRPTEASVPFWAGLSGGLATTIRLDAALIVAIGGWIFLWHEGAKLKRIGTFALGVTPPLVFLGGTNHIKWGTWLPFAYGPGAGPDLTRYLPLAVVGLTVVAVSLAVRGVRSDHRVHFTRWMTALVLFAIVGSVTFEPSRRFLLSTVEGFWILVADIRLLDEYGRPGLLRTPSGAVVYAGTLKKALLQSAPFLTAALGTTLGLRRNGEGSLRGYVALPALLYPLFFAPWAWHGGQSFNMRYLLPAVPFAVILVAGAVGRMAQIPGGTLSMTSIVRVAIVALGCHLSVWLLDSGRRETTYLIAPLILAAATAAAATALRLRPTPAISRMLGALLVGGVVWGSVVAFTYDVPRSLAVKSSNQMIAAEVGRLIQDSSVVLAEYADNLYNVRWHHEDVLVALPYRDSFQDVPFVVRSAEGAGRTVFGALTEESWERVHRMGLTSWSQVGVVDRYIVRRYGG